MMMMKHQGTFCKCFSTSHGTDDIRTTSTGPTIIDNWNGAIHDMAGHNHQPFTITHKHFDMDSEMSARIANEPQDAELYRAQECRN